MSGGIEDMYMDALVEAAVEEALTDSSNVLHTTFNKQIRSKEKLLETVKEMDFENMVLIGTKENDIYAVHTGVSDVVELIGLLEIVKMNCMLEKV